MSTSCCALKSFLSSFSGACPLHVGQVFFPVSGSFVSSMAHFQQRLCRHLGKRRGSVNISRHTGHVTRSSKLDAISNRLTEAGM